MILLPNGTLEIGYNHSIWRSYSVATSVLLFKAQDWETTGYNTRLAFLSVATQHSILNSLHGSGIRPVQSIDTGRPGLTCHIQPMESRLL